MERSRWLVVLGALLVQPCLGAIYGWGVFVPVLKATRAELTVTYSAELLQVDPRAHAALVSEFRAIKQRLAQAHAADRPQAKQSLDDFLKSVPTRLPVAEAVWTRHHYGFSGTQAQGVFSLGLLVFALVMVFAGRWQDRVGPRVVALAGGLVLAAGYALAAACGTSHTAVLVAIGVIGGAGIGLGYVCPIAACVKWFPDLKGLVTGLAVAGFGGGAYLFIRLAGNWGNWLATGGVGGTFWNYALVFAVCVSCGALLLRNPPGGWQPAGWASGSTKPGAGVTDMGQRELVRSPAFWMLWLAFVCASGCGLMVIGSLKDFGVREGGLSDAQADGALALLALFNALGRIVWGTMSQRLGARRTLVVVSFLQAAMVLALVELGSREWTLGLAACWVGFQFGGNLALFPLLTAEFFGTRNLGANYALVFTGYGVGGVLGPLLAGSVWDLLGSYRWAFLPAAGGCLLAMLLAVLVRGPGASHAEP